MNTKKMRTFIILICTVLIAATVFSGCSVMGNAVKNALNSAKNESGQTDSSSNSNTSGTTSKGSASTQAPGSTDGSSTGSFSMSDLPQGYPANTIPILSDATIIISSNSSDSSEESFVVMYSSKKSYAEAKEWYKSTYGKFTDQGTWTLGSMTSYTGKRDGYECTITVTEGDSGGSTVSITLTKKL